MRHESAQSCFYWDISWVVEELQDPAAERYENYVFNLNRVLCHVDPTLLIHRDGILFARRSFGEEQVDIPSGVAVASKVLGATLTEGTPSSSPPN